MIFEEWLFMSKVCVGLKGYDVYWVIKQWDLVGFYLFIR